MKTNSTHYILQPAQFRLDGGAMFGIIPRPMWMKVAPPDEDNRIQLALRLWLIKCGDRFILVDTGIGDYHDQKFGQRFCVEGPQSPLVQVLKKINLTVEQITDLVLSHLHFDHAGGMAIKNNQGDWQFLFPNAKLHLHQQHYDYALNPSMKDGGSFHSNVFRPIIENLERQKRVIWHQGEQGTLIQEAELNFKTSQGHTPYLMHPYNKQFIYLADLVPTAHHIHLPWVMAYDMHPGESAREKRQLFDFIAEKKLTIIFEHDPQSWGAQLGIKDGNYIAAQKLAAIGPKIDAYTIS